MKTNDLTTLREGSSVIVHERGRKHQYTVTKVGRKWIYCAPVYYESASITTVRPYHPRDDKFALSTGRAPNRTGCGATLYVPEHLEWRDKRDKLVKSVQACVKTSKLLELTLVELETLLAVFRPETSGDVAV